MGIYINYSSSKDDCPFIISGGGLTYGQKEKKKKINYACMILMFVAFVMLKSNGDRVWG